MSDLRLREAQRRADATGSAEDRRALWRERERRGLRRGCGHVLVHPETSLCWECRPPGQWVIVGLIGTSRWPYAAKSHLACFDAGRVERACASRTTPQDPLASFVWGKPSCIRCQRHVEKAHGRNLAAWDAVLAEQRQQAAP